MTLEEAKAIVAEFSPGYADFEGNGRVELEGVFDVKDLEAIAIVLRSMERPSPFTIEQIMAAPNFGYTPLGPASQKDETLK